MKKKRISKGTIIYTVFIVAYLIIGLAVVAFGLSKVWKYAEEYEASRPDNTMKAYITSLGADSWNDAMQQQIASMPHEVQTDDECAAVVQEMLRDGVTYARAPGGSDTRLIYTLYCPTGEFGKVTLTQDKSAESEYNMYPWVVSEQEFEFDGLYSSIEVTVPASYTVTLNGITLGQEYITESGIHYDVLEGYYDDYNSLPTKVTYKFDHIIGLMDPVIYDNNGNVFELDTAKDDSQFLVPCSDDEIWNMTEFCNKFVYVYFRYSSGLDGYSTIRPYIIGDSDLDNRLKAAEDGLSWAHTTSMTLDDFQLTQAIKLDTNVYLCYVTATVTAAATTVNTTTNNIKIVVRENTDNGDLRVAAIEMY